MENKVILVAETSKILSKFICAALKEKGLETVTETDGYKALRYIIENKPACVIADRQLTTINGIQLCSIIKEGSPHPEIPFILISTDEKISDFWTEASSANKILSVSPENLDELIEFVASSLEYDVIEIDDFTGSEESEKSVSKTDVPSASDLDSAVLWTVEAMERNSFYHNMLKNIFRLYEYVDNTDNLSAFFLTILYDFCPYDAAVLVLDDTPTRVYSTGLENCSEEAENAFWEICRSDYERNAAKKHTITYNVEKLSAIVPVGDEPTFNSYMSYNIRSGTTFVGTLHIASKRKKLFSYKIQSSIEFILEKCSHIFRESVSFANLSTSEAKLRMAFRKFVPDEVIQGMIESDSSQEESINEKREIAILICDIRNFTSISEINEPENVVGFLNSYFTYMVEIIKKYGGTIDKFIGDAIMVLFGAPISYNDNAQRSVDTALAMYSKLAEIPCNDLKFPEGMKFDIGIGIHLGEVIVGNIGSKDKTNYTVIGDAVNLASRLEGLTKLYGSKIIISESVAEKLNEKTNVNLLDSVKVKGKKEGVRVYSVTEKSVDTGFIKNYEKGLDLYSKGAFDLAISYFQKATKILPEDKAANLMLERCIQFKENPPENWDGAIALKSK